MATALVGRKAGLIHWRADMRILLAEDDQTIAEGLVQALGRAGCTVDAVGTGVDADNALASIAYDLLILDLGLPRLSGYEVLKRLRARKSALPVLILTAEGGVEERVRGLDAGADDYMVKPFALPELEARVRALVRRGSGNPTGIAVGDLCFDAVERVARYRGELLDLSSRELALLELLISRAGRVVGKELLVERLSGWSEDVSTNAIEVYIHRLRKKLEPCGVSIVTVRGLGYCLKKPQDAAA
jgi:two-component system OmpR family response regulator/two-component system response regulator TctD